jgi:hypothetical protein
LIVLSWITITPWVIVRRITPCQIRKPASVTTNDGTPISATIEPWKAPIAVVTRSAIRMQTRPGRCAPVGSWSSATTTPAIPLTNAIERSISPISRTKTTP